jgi:hypothetical protein
VIGEAQGVTNDILTRLGVGGILAVLVIKELFTFLRQREDKLSAKNGNGTSGNLSPEYWKGFIEGAARTQGEKTRDTVTAEASDTRKAIYANGEVTRNAVNELQRTLDQNLQGMRCKADS